VENSFFERIEQHKAILIKLDPRQHYYEALTFYRASYYVNENDRKPNLYISDDVHCAHEVIALKEQSYDDFVSALYKMNFNQSSSERYELMSRGLML